MGVIRKFEIGNIYHVYSRGVEKRNIFLEDLDYTRFMKSVFLFNSNKSKEFKIKGQYYNDEQIVEIICFTLMPNHYHFKIREIKEGGISKFMQKLNTSYTMYFNKKYDRVGALLANVFMDKLIDSDNYLSYLDRYIFFNPLKLIRKSYDSKDLLNSSLNLTRKEVNFLKNYKYRYFQGGTSEFLRFHLGNDVEK
jgi:putative transposase